MDRLFLDANVLFSAAYKPDARVRKLWNLKGVALCTSRYALEEARVNLAEESQRQRLLDLVEVFSFFEAADYVLPPGIALPDTDVPILLAAINARANYLLTGDFKHFGSYFGRKVGGVTIDSPARYLKGRE
jgi:uncharacterized protein